MEKFEAAILSGGKDAGIKETEAALSAQNLPPASVRIYPGTEAERGFGRGALLRKAIQNCGTEYLLVLDGGSCPVSADFTEKMLRTMAENTGISALYSRTCGKKSPRSLKRAMDEAWLTEKESFSLRDFYELGPEVFMMPTAACMLRVSDVKDDFIEPSGLSRPEYELNAHLLYDGKKIAKAKDAAVDSAPGMSCIRVFREAFRYGAALKLYYTSFGLSWKNTALKMNNDIIGHARRTMKKTLKTGAFWNLPPALFRMLAALLGDFLGENYHRLPLKLDRLLSADPYFS